jgi:organic radical activating enzyme
MPAASIVNGCTGALTPVTHDDFESWRCLIEEGSNLKSEPLLISKRTIGRHLHCAEFWMPGRCNLRCRHCYVASRPTPPILAEADYYRLALRLVSQGLTDVVIPGMEPLLRRELWAVLDAAKDARARSVGITTNGTLLAQHARRLHESPLTVLNVSLDGPETIHDSIRGRGVFRSVERGMRTFRRESDKRLITNTTVHSENLDCLVDIASLGLVLGVDYSAFHPFEFADDAENALASSVTRVARAYQTLIEAFRVGRTPSLVLEAEASTLAVIVELIESGLLDGCQLAIDEAGFLFLREVSGERELLISLMFYPHHFIRTIRVADNGGLSSCRSMARRGWAGLGDLRVDPLTELLQSSEPTKALAMIWQEFRSSLDQLPKGAFRRFISFLESRLVVRQLDELRQFREFRLSVST